MASIEEDFEYVSSSPLVGVDKDKKEAVADERDLPTLKRLSKRMSDDIELYNSNKSLSARDPKFTVDQQLIINQAIVMLLEGYKDMVDNGIKNVKEALNG